MSVSTYKSTMPAATFISLNAEQQAELARLVTAQFPPEQPGVVVGVLQRGARFTFGSGLANLETHQAFTPQSLFRACSITKQFVALLLLQLEEAGRLSLQDKPGKFVPALTGFDPALRLAHLAQNRSGLVDYWCAAMLTGAKPERVFTLKDGESLITSLPRQMFPPGGGTRYNNGNWRILQWVIEAITGESLGTLLHTRIFAPLGMTASSLGEDSALELPDGTIGYRHVDGHWEREVTRIVWSGDAALVTTLDDLLKWEAALLRADPILGPSARLADAMPHADGSTACYGFGINAWQHGGRRMHWHGGALRGWRMAQLRFPDDDTAVLVMLNRTANPMPLALAVASTLGVDAAWDRPSPAGDHVIGLPEPTGAWRSDQLDLVALFAEEAGHVTVSLGIDPVALTRTDTDTLTSADGFLHVEQVADHLVIKSHNLGWSARFDRLTFRDDRARLGGMRYHCAELGSDIDFASDGTRLVIIGAHGESESCYVYPLAMDHVAFDCLRALDEVPPGRFTLRIRGNTLVAGCLLAQGFQFVRSH